MNTVSKIVMLILVLMIMVMPTVACGEPAALPEPTAPPANKITLADAPTVLDLSQFLPTNFKYRDTATEDTASSWLEGRQTMLVRVPLGEAPKLPAGRSPTAAELNEALEYLKAYHVLLDYIKPNEPGLTTAGFTVDVMGALKKGIKPETLKIVGVSSDVISEAQVYMVTEGFMGFPQSIRQYVEGNAGLDSEFGKTYLFLSKEPYQLIYCTLSIIENSTEQTASDAAMKDEQRIKSVIVENLKVGATEEGFELEVPGVQVTYPSIADLAVLEEGHAYTSFGTDFGVDVLCFKSNKVYVFINSMYLSSQGLPLEPIAREIEHRIGMFTQ